MRLLWVRQWGFGRLAGLEWEEAGTWVKNGERLRVVEAVNPDPVIPVHHSTFSFYVEPIGEFATRLGRSSCTVNLVILREGDNLTSDRAAG